MTVARVSIVEHTSEDTVYSLKDLYSENFEKVFPTTQRSWVIQTGPTSSLTFTIYPNQDDADSTSSGRRDFLDSAKEKFVDDFTYVGEVICELINPQNTADDSAENRKLNKEVVELRKQLNEKIAIINAMKDLLS